MSEHVALRLDTAALHVDVRPGGEVVLRGSYASARDGSIIDAATTTWPSNAPGGASIDAGGLIDFEAGGFHVTARDPATHEVHAIATKDGTSACAAAGAQTPCLPLRVLPQARSRLLTVAEWTSSLQGGIDVEVIAPPAYAPAVSAATELAPYFMGTAVALVAVAAMAVTWQVRRRRRQSPAWQLYELGRRVRRKLERADAVVAAPLTPAIDATLQALRARRVDPGSREGQRVRSVLLRVETKLDDVAAQERAEEEQRAADDLVREVESALEAADEVALRGGRAT